MFNYRAFVVAAALTLAVSAHAKTIIVNNNSALNSVSPCSAATQTTINGALGVAVAGDIIEICPGIYPETLKITTSKLTIEGLNVGGSSLVELEPTTPAAGIPDIGTSPYGGPEDAQVSATIVVQNATKVALENIAVNGSLVGNPGNACNGVNYVGIYYANASGSITNSTVAYSGLNPDGSLTGCQEGHGIYVDSGSGGAASLTVEYTSVHDFDKSGIDSFGNGTILTAKYNTVTGVGPTTLTAQNGVEVIYGAAAVVNNNTISAVDYTPSSSSATGILFYQAGEGGQANNNAISQTNGAVYYYQTNKGEANGNVISDTINYGPLGAYQATAVTFKSNSITGSSNVEGAGEPLAGDLAQPAIYVCGSKNVVEDNTINDALIGVQIDETSMDSCSGSSGNKVSGNKYLSVGINSQTETSASVVFINGKARHMAGFGKPVPSR